MAADRPASTVTIYGTLCIASVLSLPLIQCVSYRDPVGFTECEIPFSSRQCAASTATRWLPIPHMFIHVPYGIIAVIGTMLSI